MSAPHHHQACRELVTAAFGGIPWRDRSTMDVAVGGVRVEVSVYNGRRGSGVRVTVLLEPAPIMPRLFLHPKNVKMLWETRVVLGDDAFDARWNVCGVPKEIVTRALTPPPALR